MHDGAPSTFDHLNGHTPNLAEPKCSVCASALRTRPTGKDTSETYCSLCEREERLERARQQEHEEQMLGLAPREIMRCDKTARERGREIELRRKLDSVSVSSIILDAVFRFFHKEREKRAGVEMTLTLNRKQRNAPTLTTSATLPWGFGSFEESISLTTWEGGRGRSRQIRHRLHTITLQGKYWGEQVVCAIRSERSKQLDFFLDAHGIVPLRRKNRPAGMRLSSQERREERTSFADPGERHDTTQTRRDKRRGHKHGFKPLNHAHEARRKRELQKDFDLRTAFLPYSWSPRKLERLSPSSGNEIERLAKKYGNDLPPAKKPNRATRTREALAARACHFN